MANVNCISKNNTDYMYEDTAGRNLIGSEQDTSTTAIKAYAVGDLFWLNNLLYRVTSAIASGGTITVGTNCVATTVSAELAARVKSASLATVATSGSYNDLSDKPTIPAAQIQSDWSQTNTSAKDYIKNKPSQLGHTMLPTPSSSVNEAAVVSAINTAITTDGGANDDVASLFGVGKWSNTISKTYVVQGSTKVGTSGIGTWPADPDNPTAAEKATWVTVPLLVGCSSNTGLDIKLTFDPTTVSVPIVLGGYIIDDSDGKMCIKFGNEIPSADTATAKIGIELIIKRTENEIAVS